MSISTKEFLKEFKDLVEDKGGEVEAAKYFGVSRSFVNNVSSGSCLPGGRILSKMKLRPVKEIKYRYERVEK